MEWNAYLFALCVCVCDRECSFKRDTHSVIASPNHFVSAFAVKRLCGLKSVGGCIKCVMIFFSFFILFRGDFAINYANNVVVIYAINHSVYRVRGR